MFFFIHFCAVCGKSSDLYNVNAADCNGVKLIDKLRQCLPKIDYSDESHICEYCSSLLNVNYEFTKVAHRTNIMFNYYKSKICDDSNYSELMIKVTGDVSKNEKENSHFNSGGVRLTLHAYKRNLKLKSVINELKSNINRKDNVFYESPLNDKVPQKKKGVTGIFCHTVIENTVPDKKYERFKDKPKSREELRLSQIGKRVKDRKSAVNLRKIVNNHQPIEKKLFVITSPRKNAQYICPVCSEPLQDRINLRQHLSVHLNNNLRCVLCKKVLGTKKSLRNHLIIHSEPKSYKCKLCPKQFCFKLHLVDHFRKLHQKSCISKTRNLKKKKVNGILAVKPVSDNLCENIEFKVNKSKTIKLNTFQGTPVDAASDVNAKSLHLSYEESKLIFLSYLDLQNTKEYELNKKLYCLRSKTQISNTENTFVIPNDHLTMNRHRTNGFNYRYSSYKSNVIRNETENIRNLFSKPYIREIEVKLTDCQDLIMKYKNNIHKKSFCRLGMPS